MPPEFGQGTLHRPGIVDQLGDGEGFAAAEKHTLDSKMKLALELWPGGECNACLHEQSVVVEAAAAAVADPFEQTKDTRNLEFEGSELEYCFPWLGYWDLCSLQMQHHLDLVGN